MNPTKPNAVSPGLPADATTPQALVADEARPLETRPYLRIFGPDTGVNEVYLTNQTLTIGRSDHADIQLRHHTVSRIHATIALCDGEYVIEDADSNFGVLVNSRRVERSVLRHGDTIQISLYVVQFRTHPAPPGAAAAAARAKFLLRSDFCMLPSTMRLRFRMLHVEPREIFRRGDTLRVGHGGLLVPTDGVWDDTPCTELELCWPTGQTKRYLGEVLGLIEEGALHWGCIKLHIVPREIHDATVEAGEPGPWIDVTAT
ncbi:MAG TPA: FHA domain-containing protein [Phycisphaerae bacterium]|nr:FHA domain-containing protein [Phycisphaerae bacterium]HPM24803.1 FHA domain-containing protein [Phycisphaerae bacterium]